MLRQWTPRDDRDLLKMKEQGFTDSQIAKHFNCTSNRVNKRLRTLQNKREGQNAPKRPAKPKRSRAAKSRLERLHLARLSLLPCAVAGENCSKRVEVHHIRHGYEARNHKMAIPLCSHHHRDNKEGYHGMSREKFDRRYNINARELAERLWQQTLELKTDD